MKSSSSKFLNQRPLCSRRLSVAAIPTLRRQLTPRFVSLDWFVLSRCKPVEASAMGPRGSLKGLTNLCQITNLRVVPVNLAGFMQFTFMTHTRKHESPNGIDIMHCSKGSLYEVRVRDSVLHIAGLVLHLISVTRFALGTSRCRFRACLALTVV